MATQTLLTLEQFLDLPAEEGQRRELDEGLVIEMAPPARLHGKAPAVAHCRDLHGSLRRSMDGRRGASGFA